jgi:hypothetical protein
MALKGWSLRANAEFGDLMAHGIEPICLDCLLTGLRGLGRRDFEGMGQLMIVPDCGICRRATVAMCRCVAA